MTSLQLLLSSAALFLLLPSSSLADDTHCHIDVAIDNGYTTFVSAAISSGYVTELAGIDETLSKNFFEFQKYMLVPLPC